MRGARWPFPLHRRAVLYPPLHQRAARVALVTRPVEPSRNILSCCWAQEKGLEHLRCGVQVRICDNTTASVEDPSSARDGAVIGVFIRVWGIRLALHLLTILHLCSIVPIGFKLWGVRTASLRGFRRGEATGGRGPIKLKLSSYLYTLAAGSGTLDSVLAAFSPLRRQDRVCLYPTSCSSLRASLAALGAREEGPENVRGGSPKKFTP
jgi:hypothetical protein